MVNLGYMSSLLTVHATLIIHTIDPPTAPNSPQLGWDLSLPSVGGLSRKRAYLNLSGVL